MGVMILYVIANIVLVGYLTDRILTEIFPGYDIVYKFGGIWIYYILLDFMARFFLQPSPAMKVKPLLHLPIKRRTLFHYILMKSVPNLFNISPFFIIVPFFFKAVVPEYGLMTQIAWMMTFISLTLFTNFISIYVKKHMMDNIGLSYGILFGAVFLFIGDIMGWFSTSSVFEKVIGAIVDMPVLVVIPIALVGLIYWLNYQFLQKHIYLEKLAPKAKQSVRSTTNFSFLDRFGKIGELIQLELKLMLRNKRPKSLLWVTGLFLFYGLIFYTSEHYAGQYMMFAFIGIFLTGIFTLNYGQFLWSWESSYFDFLLSRNIQRRDMIEAKFWLFTAVSTLCFFLTLPYGLLDVVYIKIQALMFVYNIGVNTYIMMAFGALNRKGIDISQGSAFSFQGVSGSHFLLMIPITAFPAFIYLPFSLYYSPFVAMYVLAGIGVLGILLKRPILNGLTQQFSDNRYQMAAGFRKN